MERPSWDGMVSFARQFETSFFEDMSAMHVSPPSAVLRVSDHMHEIEQYVRTLRDGGCAYEVIETEGNTNEGKAGVYFDVGKMEENYGKLGSIPPPDDRTQAADSTGAGGSGSAVTAFKKSHRDFSLWKNAKAGEPRWAATISSSSSSNSSSNSTSTNTNTNICSSSSPSLSAGRPGWHIECSAMTHAYFGPKLDLHSGGVDLKFPHHTNEIAQSEAHFHASSDSALGEGMGVGVGGREQAVSSDSFEWVKVWLHTGEYMRKRR